MLSLLRKYPCNGSWMSYISDPETALLWLSVVCARFRQALWGELCWAAEPRTFSNSHCGRLDESDHNRSHDVQPGAWRTEQWTRFLWKLFFFLTRLEAERRSSEWWPPARNVRREHQSRSDCPDLQGEGQPPRTLSVFLMRLAIRMGIKWLRKLMEFPYLFHSCVIPVA